MRSGVRYSPFGVLMCIARSRADLMGRMDKMGNSVLSLLQNSAQYIHFGILKMEIDG